MGQVGFDAPEALERGFSAWDHSGILLADQIAGRMAASAVGCRTAAAVVLVDKICSVEAAQFRALDVGVGERGVMPEKCIDI